MIRMFCSRLNMRVVFDREIKVLAGSEFPYVAVF